ncbi:MAG: alpha-glucosidase [Alphaproteobacteria bacterium]|nr:alpha-glucosidase [Alphaproteobacteria bacterium]
MTDRRNNEKTNNDWWRGAVLYQIYPRSFFDTNGDGVGDLKGITAKLDYVADLGVEGIWISPFFKSPMKDFGYDVSDYRDIDPLFGTMADFDHLLAEAHKRDLKIIVDLVLSHTSDQHPWFTESRSSRDNPKADWYVWADPKPDGSPPNNWQSVFGGSAWQFDSVRGQYYLHNWLKEQADLNYHNPDVMAAMIDNCKFWLDKGIDGIRFDVINFCFHDKELRDNPPRSADVDEHATQLEFLEPYGMQRHIYDKSRPENLELVAKLRALLDQYPGTFSLAEIGDDEAVKMAAEYTAGHDRFHTSYSFALMRGEGRIPNAALFRDTLTEQMAQKGDSWPSWAFSNHDIIRTASRWGGRDPYTANPAAARLFIALLTSLRGTAFMYQGEELGLPEADVPFDRLQDPWGIFHYPRYKGRDGCRTPMPWDGKAKNAGFSKARDTWLPIPDTHLPLAAKRQEKDKSSTLHFTRRFFAWRKTIQALRIGDIAFLDLGGNEQILGFTRTQDDQSVLCLFNLSEVEQTVKHPATGPSLFDAGAQTGGAKDGMVTLPPFGVFFTKI